MRPCLFESTELEYLPRNGLISRLALGNSGSVDEGPVVQTSIRIIRGGRLR